MGRNGAGSPVLGFAPSEGMHVSCEPLSPTSGAKGSCRLRVTSPKLETSFVQKKIPRLLAISPRPRYRIVSNPLVYTCTTRNLQYNFQGERWQSARPYDDGERAERFERQWQISQALDCRVEIKRRLPACSTAQHTIL